MDIQNTVVECFTQEQKKAVVRFTGRIDAYKASNWADCGRFIYLYAGLNGDVQPPDKFKIISFFDFERDYLKKTRPQFVVGKWYKCRCNQNYFRFFALEGDYFQNDQQINPLTIEHGGIKPGFHQQLCEQSLVEYFDPTNVVDIKDIQQFLPIGHVDKIVQNLIGRYLKATCDTPNGIGEMKKGDYFHIISPDGGIAFKTGNSWCWSYPIPDWELMPAGFVPSEGFIPAIELAKRKYPVGTKYKNGSEVYEVTSMNWKDSGHPNIIWGEDGKGIIYNQGTWSEIVLTPQHKQGTVDSVKLFDPNNWCIAVRDLPKKGENVLRFLNSYHGSEYTGGFPFYGLKDGHHRCGFYTWADEITIHDFNKHFGALVAECSIPVGYKSNVVNGETRAYVRDHSHPSLHSVNFHHVDVLHVEAPIIIKPEYETKLIIL